jgi:DNA-binding NtrC family response regulator
LAAEANQDDDELPAVLITGETGTGKELVARALHFEGRRRDAPFVELNCSTIPGDLRERALAQTHGNVTQAARLLGVSRDTLRYRIDKHALKVP